MARSSVLTKDTAVDRSTRSRLLHRRWRAPASRVRWITAALTLVLAVHAGGPCPQGDCQPPSPPSPPAPVASTPVEPPAAETPGEAPSPLPSNREAAPLAPRTADATPVRSPADVTPASTPEADATASLGDQAPRSGAVRYTATKFQGMEPGLSTESDVLQKLGRPLQQTPREAGSAGSVEESAESIWSYKLGPFPRVELTIQEGRVSSIFVKMAGLPDVSEVARQLGVDHLRNAVVLGTRGMPLGVVYPERGVMFSLRQRSGDAEREDNNGGADADAVEEPVYGVFSILLEPVNAELFVTRARNTPPAQCSNRIADLDAALELDPRHAEALGLKASIYASLGEVRKALKLARQAEAAAGDKIDWRLLAARLTAAQGDVAKARQQAEELASTTGVPPLLQANLSLLTGDLLAIDDRHDDAVKHHQRAIQLAKPFAKNEADEVRRDALRILAEAHLAVANDIAWGNWRKKAQVTPMWIENGHRFADLLVSQEGADPILSQRVQRLTLTAYAGFSDAMDAGKISREAIRQAELLSEEADDPLYQQRIDWELGETMYYAMMAERRRGAYETALEFARIASPLFTKTIERRELTPAESYMVGQLHFLAGSCLAVEAERHEDAVKWYAIGAPLLVQPFPASVVKDPSELGDQLVGMAVSYWKANQIQPAISLTRRGVNLLQQASMTPEQYRDRRPSIAESLRIAYGNLAAMLRAAGNQQEAERWDQRISQLKRLAR